MMRCVLALAALCSACSGAPADPGRPIALYSLRAPSYLPACVPGGCDAVPIEKLRCRPARTVIVAGHSLPPVYLERTAEQLATAIACFGPELIVLDTCYGATTELLRSLHRRQPDAVVVAAPFWIGAGGLIYEPAFFGPAPPEQRAQAVRSRGTLPLLRARIDPTVLAAAEARARALPPAARLAARRFREPELVAVPFLPGQEVLIALDPEELTAHAP